MGSPGLLEFGSFRFDTGKRVLWRDDELVKLTPKALALLQALIEARGDVVLKPELMARVWPDAAVEEGSLNVTVATLRRALGTREDGASWVETVPRRGYRFAGALRGGSLAAPALMMAVLPFRSIGADAEPHLGLGMADALIARLTGMERLRVRPTGAVAQYASQPIAPQAAAELLGVDAVLDGTLQRQGDRLRLAVQLVPRSAAISPWAASFDTSFGDVFAVQDEIAEKVVHALSALLGRWRRAPTWAIRRTNVEAWETWLRGCYFWLRLDAAGLAKAVGCFGEAAVRDPAWAPPYAGLAGAHVLLAIGGIVPPRQAWRLADECAREALRRDPGLPEGHLARAWVALYRDWAWEAARTTVERAVALGPVEMHHWRAFLLALLGEQDEAMKALVRARESDPLSAVALALAAFLHDIGGRLEESIAVAQRAVELRPEHYLGYFRLGVALSRVGRHEKAIAAHRQAVERSAGGVVMRCELARALAAAGRRDDARSLLAEIDATGTTLYVSPYQRAKVLSALGEDAEALGQLERAAGDRDSWITLLGVDPALDSLRVSRRFRRLSDRVLPHRVRAG